MASELDTVSWKNAVLTEPSISAVTTAHGAALSVLLTGVEVRLQDHTAPLVATRTAAVVATCAGAEPGSGIVRHTMRGFAHLTGGGTTSVVVVAGGTPTLIEPKPDDSGEWEADFDAPLPASTDAAYPLVIIIVGSRPTTNAEVFAGIDSVDLLLGAREDALQQPEDPAAPAGRDEAPDTDSTARARAANFGVDAPAEGRARTRVSFDVGATTAISVDFAVAEAFLQACMTSNPRVTYGLGAKLPHHGAVPGQEFQKVDCSGFVREAIWRATAPHMNFPDGSVVQHEWVQAHNLPKGTPAAAMAKDGVVRIAFLRPQDSEKGIGHVVLIRNARTLESHGGVGPNSRDWTATGWQAKSRVYTLNSVLA